MDTVDPGPVGTDHLSPGTHGAVAALFPAGRRGVPGDPARLIARPATDEAGRITGQVIDSEGGFRR